MRSLTRIVLVGLIVMLAALPGCNTIRGVGSDLRYGGEKIYQACGLLGRGVKALTPGKDRHGKDQSSPSAQ